MRILASKPFRYCTLFVCAVIVAGGCRLERRPIVNWAKVEPALYCPGDTVTASFDFLGPETCPSDANCGREHPWIGITSTPESFPARRVNDFVDSFTFAPTADSVDVRFDTDRDTVRVPTARFEGGVRVVVERTQVLDTTRNTRLLVGTDAQSLPHGSSCVGLMPTYMPVEVPGMPRLSPRVRLEEVINENGVPVRYVISGSAPGEVYEQVLMPGDRIRTDMPGVPASIAGARTIEAYPTGLMCTPGSGSVDSPPTAPPLRTGVRMGCR